MQLFRERCRVAGPVRDRMRTGLQRPVETLKGLFGPGGSRGWMLAGFVIVLFTLLWYRSGYEIHPSWTFQTMGTHGQIRVCGRMSKVELCTLRADVERTLAEVNALFSIWMPESEISLINAGRTMDPIPVSEEFFLVTQAALYWSDATGGAFDPTVKPILDAWGFGPVGVGEIPAGMMDRVGWRKIELRPGELVKLHPELELDYSGIAKGYGVDRVVEQLRQRALKGFLVEIGGEIVAQGQSPSGGGWRIGIEVPGAEDRSAPLILQTLTLSEGQAVATSGDYRNYRVREDGSRYSHIMNPATGHPAESDVAGVTVLAARCMDADAVATALFVMGFSEGSEWIERHPGLEALFIVHAGKGEFSVHASSGFPAR